MKYFENQYIFTLSQQAGSRSNNPITLNEDKEMSADYLVNCITMPVFKNIPVTPALSPEKQYVVDNLNYSSYPFFVFEASSRFWLEDGFKSINMEFNHPDISSIWEETN